MPDNWLYLGTAILKHARRKTHIRRGSQGRVRLDQGPATYRRMQSHLKCKAPGHGERDTLVSEPPPSKRLESAGRDISILAPSTGKSSTDHTEPVWTFPLYPLEHPLGSPQWEVLREGGRLPFPGSWRKISRLCSCPPIAGTPHEIGKADGLLQPATLPTLGFLSLWLLAYSFCKPMAENTPCYHTKQNRRSRRSVAEADTLSSQAKQLNC